MSFDVVRRLREEKGLSQEQLAERVGVSQSMITYIERGLKQPSVAVLKRIASEFECTVDELLGA